jgi:hypothetical protein
VTNQGKDVTRGIQPRFLYQFASLDYCEPNGTLRGGWNTNVDVFEEIKEYYPRSSKYAKA